MPDVLVKERPIIFTGDSPRLIREGVKTQTRRVMKPQPYPNGYHFDRERGDFLCHEDCYPPSATLWRGGWLGADAGELECCPYGQPGDRLWVRETWAPFIRGDGGDGWVELLRYRADEAERRVPPMHSQAWDRLQTDGYHWRSSRFMPRWACRLVLEVTGVRVERLQQITEKDARAEGATAKPGHLHAPFGCDCEPQQLTPRQQFALLWENLNGRRGFGWDANPWVWVISYRRIDA